ncbi:MULTISPECIES: sulfotransferase family 2 domain-containing protein [Cytobacillus]|uniref:sulfotransferase family 2 domain-containing protein n=1 Tax=Cytobacillus TaxID=2675230 RepID=UPI00203F4579|nr:sulfotransferase family 2 domain-containing protein [Cytobacillus oceanisediminis]MBY0159621.1 sulfotransferase family 2 domain-containing protein [Cytobacillus firmus]MCM3527622.1 sulfotransferase family protein [Cytobacillus oceanisediminis]USK46571.1 sulfotransferase family protein [Cytobacillus oceanisediminis]
MEEKLIIFLHIPKTGGSTLNYIFRKHYSEKEIFDHVEIDKMIEQYNRLDDAERQTLKAISGHHFYGIHEHFLKPCLYFTMLREPIDRVISLYYFLREYPGYYQDNMKNMSLEEYIEWDPQARNGQTLQLCGSQNLANLQKAKENLETFPVFGITEKFNESLYLLKRNFGWSNIDYTKKNITRVRPSLQEVPAKTIKKIEQYNQLDIELYRFAEKKLTKQLEQLSKLDWEEIKKIKAT